MLIVVVIILCLILLVAGQRLYRETKQREKLQYSINRFIEKSVERACERLELIAQEKNLLVQQEWDEPTIMPGVRNCNIDLRDARTEQRVFDLAIRWTSDGGYFIMVGAGAHFTERYWDLKEAIDAAEEQIKNYKLWPSTPK